MAAIAQHYDEDRPRAGISATEATTWRATGAYTMGAQLGSGGFGSVFVGWSDLGGARSRRRTPDALRRLDHEARLLARVAGHANVVALVGRFDRGLALEFCGVELFEYFFHSGGFEEAAAASYAGQLFSGVAHCHGRGVFHRDVKPENLLLSEHLQLKIVDFGLGAVDDGRPLTHPCGTAGYMAPEILGACERGAAACYDGAPADCWSCAVVAFLLCKRAAADGRVEPGPRRRARDAWILEESLPPDELRAAMRKRADAVTAATRRVSSAADDDAPPLFRGASDDSEAREVSLTSDEFLGDDARGDVYRSLDVPEDAPRRSLAAVRAPRALVGALLPAAAAALGALARRSTPRTRRA
ncbi:serine/threonine kinase [Aureococcus anophagefferens]|nr:serine/threonine kinase [Aureococcus anophagefferens]